MKTPRCLSLVCSVIAGACMVFAPGAAHANAAGIGVAATTGGNAAASGGHGAAVNAGSAHVAAASASHGTGTLRSGGNLRSITATYSGPPHYLPGGFAPNVTSHGPTSTAVAGRVGTNPLGISAASQPRTTGPLPAARAQNAWSDPPAANRAFNSSRLIGSTQNNNSQAGSVLYANSFRNPAGNRFGHGRGNGDNYGRGSRYRYWRGYGNYYGYPGVFVGGYDPYFYGDTAGLAEPGSDYAATSVNTDVGDSNAPSPEAQNELSRPYGAEPSYPAAADTGPDAQVTPPDPAASNGAGNRTANGPDSLVEAVQAELARRGYFGGKIDAVYNDATHAAIKRFQTDQNLPASGRVNEATLHALQLD